jgi:hypothetical protein
VVYLNIFYAADELMGIQLQSSSPSLSALVLLFNDVNITAGELLPHPVATLPPHTGFIGCKSTRRSGESAYRILSLFSV